MIYKGEYLNEIIFPLGGIGTGSIGLAGNGSLVDWEIKNRPDKGSINGCSHFAIRAKMSDGTVIAKVLNGDFCGSYMGNYVQRNFDGYGYGPQTDTMCGYPHFESCEFDGEFPVAKINFSDKDFPAEVTLTAFNPFIPLDDKNSSIPAAFFEVEIKNISDEEIEFSPAFSVANLMGKGTSKTDGNMVTMRNSDGIEDIGYGDMTVAADGGDVFCQACWYRGEWRDSKVTFWNEFSSGEQLRSREYADDGIDTCTVMSTVSVDAGDIKKVRFVLTWNVPNNYNYWKPVKDESGNDVTWKNYYATIFENSKASAKYCLENWNDLYARTEKFRNALYSTSLDKNIIDRAAANLSVLKSPTVLRLEDGSFYGWEGVHEKEGSCEGTCQHVWNYAYAMCFLFPKLEQSIRDIEFRYNTYENGRMEFRLQLPLGREKMGYHPCVDGQMGTVIKIYRDWKISGDSEWLKKNWENIKLILEYAWDESNEYEWDKNKDGVIDGRQHHTLDMELFGASSWLEGFYLAALKAAAEMAEFMGDTEKEEEYRGLFEKGYSWTKENLFNGEYFVQRVDLNDKSITDRFGCSDNYWNDEAEEIKYQINNGSSIDQMCAQWHADIIGLGDIYDREQVDIALSNMYKNNFKTSMRDFTNPWRIFSINDEGGAVICDFPESATKPAIPVPYCEETMTGFEYQLAGLLISRGKIKEGTELVDALADRFNGKKRNPWNEFECGSNYARSMASFALLPIFGGFIFDLPKGKIGFNPLCDSKNYKTFWSLGTGWGTAEMSDKSTIISIAEGKLTLSCVELPYVENISRVIIDGKEVDYTFDGKDIVFDKTLIKSFIEVVYNEEK